MIYVWEMQFLNAHKPNLPFKTSTGRYFKEAGYLFYFRNHQKY